MRIGTDGCKDRFVVKDDPSIQSDHFVWRDQQRIDVQFQISG